MWGITIGGASGTPSPAAPRVMRANQGVLDHVQRTLASGSRIARGADDPAGLIAAERLRAELTTLEVESHGLERTEAAANIAGGALHEISGMLSEAGAIAVANANAGGMSDAEREANQLNLDSILGSIDRIASATTFNGTRLLDGSAMFSAAGASVGVPSAGTADLGAIVSGGATYRLSDARTGGAIHGDATLTGASVRGAAAQIGNAVGRIGAFVRSTIEPAKRTLAVAIENTAAAHAVIRDTDFAAQSAALARTRAMRDASLTALALANAAPQRALGLLS